MEAAEAGACVGVEELEEEEDGCASMLSSISGKAPFFRSDLISDSCPHSTHSTQRIYIKLVRLPRGAGYSVFLK